VEKSFLKKLSPRRAFDENFYSNIKDLGQFEKYQYLKDWLLSLGYNFDSNLKCKNIFDRVFNFFQNRSKWKSLYKARDDIIKMSMGYKEVEGDSKLDHNKLFRKSSKEITSVNETDELRVEKYILNFVVCP
jgi:hypothetical protein